MYLIFDTETTGLPKNFKAPISDTENWPRCVQIAWQLHDDMGNLIEHEDYLIKPEGFDIPYDSERIHGISTALAEKKGNELQFVINKFLKALEKTKFIVGQNLKFDVNIMGAELFRLGQIGIIEKFPILDTCTETTAKLTQIPGGRGGRFKLPTLTELHQYLFNQPFKEAHNATADVEATTRCFLELIRRDVFSVNELQNTSNYIQQFKEKNPKPFELIGLKHINLSKASEKIRKELEQKIITNDVKKSSVDLTKHSYAHLHNHTQYSVLQSTIELNALIKRSAEYKMPAIAMTDHGNLMGAYKFVDSILKHNAKSKKKNAQLIEDNNEPTETIIKPIIGCEFYVCENHTDKTKKDNGYQIVLLAKNKNGYNNLIKLASIAAIEGFYYVPRIDKKLIEKYKKDIIVLSGNLQGEIPNKILNMGERQAEEALLWWQKQFGDDFYLEIMKHLQEDENRANTTMLQLANKHKIKTIATNNTYYLNKEDANAHDILLCVRDGEKQATPVGRGRGHRYGLPNQEYYYKSQEEMKQLFVDNPEAIINIQEVVDKIQTYTLKRDILLPQFDIPEEFIDKRDENPPIEYTKEGKEKKPPKYGENAYLKFLTFEGAKKRYGTISPETEERLNFELNTIKNSGYPGYFLIVQDFIAAARKMGVSVGPGRGSAAGSAVAYCLKITNIDPIKYDLLFERFLNPDRISMPDIDIDFDDEGRGRVMDYVIKKYGKEKVAQIITYGKMATKSAIKDAARVLDLPLQDSERIAKLIPTMMPSKWNLRRLISEPESEVKKAVKTGEHDAIKELVKYAQQDDLIGETLSQAKIIEGSLRNTGVHACGVIITPDDITNFVPIQAGKGSDLCVTQFDNSVAEDAGLLKMDFLGLKTLTLIKDTIEIIKQKHNIEIDAEEIPIDDVKTYELFQRGETIGIFQYESAGMQKYMRELKPTVFEDLIAMNALYRPGPLEYIPSFIKRKHGIEEIIYDLDDMKEYLSETYGITVYQEQVMLLSQKLADFTKGEADVLRKAMGKKQIAVLEKMKPRFLKQAIAKGHDEQKLEKIWKDWEAFASYAFNKSHSTCYAWIGYQTAYLKAHYPAEFMAAVLTNNMNDIKKVTFFMEESSRMGVSVLGPDVNESFYKFTVNNKNQIRFGIGAIKGVGEGAVETIIENRKNKDYKSIFEFSKRIDLRSANKKAFEGLALAGAFDCFTNINRSQYFYKETDKTPSLIEMAIKFGAKVKELENSSQMSLFGGTDEEEIPEPKVPICEEWTSLEKLEREKEVVGFYISGHPLNDFKYELNHFCKNALSELNDLQKIIGKTITIGGMITQSENRTGSKGKDWGMFTLVGFNDSYNFRIFGENYMKFRHLLRINTFVSIKLSIAAGYFNQNTQKQSDPRINFLDVKPLNEVLEKSAKKLTLEIDVNTINENDLLHLKKTLNEHTGQHTLDFEFFELEVIEATLNNEKNISVVDIDNVEHTDESLEIETSDLIEVSKPLYNKKNKIDMISTKNKIQINSELLEDLEKYKFNFKVE